LYLFPIHWVYCSTHIFNQHFSFSIATPAPGKGEVLIKNVCGAINPVDWKQVQYNFWIPSYPFVVGCDIAGTVEAVGEGVTNLKKGDRVWAYLRLATDIKYGAYQEYCISFADRVGKIPPNMSFEDAATLGLGTFTPGIALYYDVKIPIEGPPPTDTLLIWAASSSVGSFGVQLAKYTGFKHILATCSPKNFDYVKSLGATHVFDVHAPDVIQQIKDATHNKLSLVYDAFGATPNIIPALGENGGTIVTVLGNSVPKELPSNVKATGTYAGNIFNDKTDGPEVGVKLIQHVDKLLSEGKYRPNNVQLIPNGFLGIEEAHKLMKSGQVSAAKLVYRVNETPGL